MVMSAQLIGVLLEFDRITADVAHEPIAPERRFRPINAA